MSPTPPESTASARAPRGSRRLCFRDWQQHFQKAISSNKESQLVLQRWKVPSYFLEMALWIYIFPDPELFATFFNADLGLKDLPRKMIELADHVEKSGMHRNESLLKVLEMLEGNSRTLLPKGLAHVTRELPTALRGIASIWGFAAETLLQVPRGSHKNVNCLSVRPRKDLLATRALACLFLDLKSSTSLTDYAAATNLLPLLQNAREVAGLRFEDMTHNTILVRMRRYRRNNANEFRLISDNIGGVRSPQSFLVYCYTPFLFPAFKEL